MLTKNQYKIMQLAVSSITKKFSIREIARILKMNNSLAHRTIKPLIDKNMFIKDEKGYLSLNYNNNYGLLSFSEYLRRNSFLQKNKSISILTDEIIEKLPFEYFTLIIFGSTVINSKPRDLDLLLIVEQTDEIEKAEKHLYNITRNYTSKIHSVVISFESVYEMLALRDSKNVMNEILNKHLILYGGELFYRLLKKGRK